VSLRDTSHKKFSRRRLFTDIPESRLKSSNDRSDIAKIANKMDVNNKLIAKGFLKKLYEDITIVYK
jgi:hypothetical protein